MRIIKNIEELKKLRVTSLSIGNFDGVHLGHQAIIKRLTRLPHSLIVTFTPHPLEILFSLRSEAKELAGVLTSIDEKAAIMKESGVENLFILEFDDKLANMEAEDFIKWLVIDYIKPKRIVIGYNHRFGRGASGDFELLVHMGASSGFKVIRLPPIYVEGFPVSSTWVRRALIKGDVELATKLLGRPYSLVSQVISGEKLGGMLSYPTANLRVPANKLIPKSGVYAVYVEYGQQKFAGMMNIGGSPTFGKPFGIEVHIFDFTPHSGKLLNEELKVEFVKYLRDIRAFPNSEALKMQLKQDEQLARQVLASS